MPAIQPPEGPPGQLLRAVQTGRSQWKQDKALLRADITVHTWGSAPAAARVSAAFLPCAHPGQRTGQAWRMRRTAGPYGVHDCRWGARRAGSPRDPTQGLYAPRGPGLGPCSWPSASAPPVSDPQNLISPPPGALRANSSLITRGSRLSCDVSGVPGPICQACLLGTLLSSDAWLPLAPSFRLELSPLSSSLRAHPGCYGNAAAGTRWWLGAGSQECRSLRHFRCQAPSRRSGGGSWSGVGGGTRGLPRPRRFLVGHGRWQEGRYERGSEDIRWRPGWGRGG